MVETFSAFNDRILDIKSLKNDKILVCTNSNSLRVYDSLTGKVSLLVGHSDLAMSCDVSSDLAVSGGKDGRVLLWSIDSQGELTLTKKYKGH